MKRFAFRLESLMKLRAAAEDAAKRVFGAARKAAEQQAGEVKRFELSETLAKSEMRSAQGTGEVRVADLMAHQRYLVVLGRRVAAERTKLAERESEATKARESLIVASRDLKTMERLRERRLGEWTVDMLKEEQRELDEASSAARMAGGLR